jgi:HAD superfamily hydrolase (TIGR01509 family)
MTSIYEQLSIRKKQSMSDSASNGYGLLMDLDGTIANTLPHLFNSFRHAVAPFVETPPTDRAIYDTFGPPEYVCITQMILKGGLHAGPLDDKIIAAAVERYHGYYEGRHEEVTLFEGIADVIHSARDRGWRFGVCTGKGRRSAEFTLAHLGLWEWTDLLISGDDVVLPKPNPEGVKLALRQWDLPAERVLVVGDTEADIRAGSGAGAHTVAALWGAFEPELTLAAKPTWAFQHVGELGRLIAGINGKSLEPVPFRN